MKRFLFLIILFCGCPKGATPVETAVVKPTLSSDLFEVIEAWQQTPDGTAFRELAVERLVYVGDGYDVVLASAESVDSGGEAVILRVIKAGDGWRVDAANKGKADYLWPAN